MTELGNRQSAILMQLQTDGEVSVDALARQHGVTTQQIRRDLSVLCDAGMAARTHGGARRRVRDPGEVEEDQTDGRADGRAACGRACLGA